MTLESISSPSVLIDDCRLNRNIQKMQKGVEARGVALWPHIKTHKTVPILCRQLEAGAKGATCAKLGEAELMLSSGVRRIFIAYSLVQLELALRLRTLADSLDELILAVTSEVQFQALEALLTKAGIKEIPVLLAVDTGLHREGVRSPEAGVSLAQKIAQSDRVFLRGLYTHEGHAYSASADQLPKVVDEVHSRLQEVGAAIGGKLPLWPGCSVTALSIGQKENVEVVRPGSYVLGDLSLTDTSRVMEWGDASTSILATVVDLPETGLALINAGTKMFSSDLSDEGIYARERDGRALAVTRLSEEHGFVTGSDVSQLKIGERLRFIPSHVCPVMNLASKVYLVDGNQVIDTWEVNARGRSD